MPKNKTGLYVVLAAILIVVIGFVAGILTKKDGTGVAVKDSLTLVKTRIEKDFVSYSLNLPAKSSALYSVVVNNLFPDFVLASTTDLTIFLQSQASSTVSTHPECVAEADDCDWTLSVNDIFNDGKIISLEKYANNYFLDNDSFSYQYYTFDIAGKKLLNESDLFKSDKIIELASLFKTRVNTLDLDDQPEFAQSFIAEAELENDGYKTNNLKANSNFYISNSGIVWLFTEQELGHWTKVFVSWSDLKPLLLKDSLVEYLAQTFENEAADKIKKQEAEIKKAQDAIKGDETIPTLSGFAQQIELGNGELQVEKDGKWGIVSKDGVLVVAPSFTKIVWVGDFSGTTFGKGYLNTDEWIIFSYQGKASVSTSEYVLADSKCAAAEASPLLTLMCSKK